MLLRNFTYRGAPVVINTDAIVALQPAATNGETARTIIYLWGGFPFTVDGSLSHVTGLLNEVHRTAGTHE